MNALYKWFIETSEDIGVSAYSVPAVPIYKSDEGWCQVCTRERGEMERGI